MRIGWWSDDYSRCSATLQAMIWGVSATDTNIRLIVLSRFLAHQVIMPRGRASCRLVVAALLSRLSTAMCCVRYHWPPQLG